MTGKTKIVFVDEVKSLTVAESPATVKARLRKRGTFAKLTRAPGGTSVDVALANVAYVEAVVLPSAPKRIPRARE
jgi:hypothetical protein